MQINKQLLEELILEVLEEEEEVDEELINEQIREVFNFNPFSSKKTAKSMANTRGGAVEEPKAFGAPPTTRTAQGGGLRKDLGTDAAGKLSGGASMKMQLMRPQVQQALNVMKDTIIQQPRSNRALFVAGLLVDMGIEVEDVQRLASALRDETGEQRKQRQRQQIATAQHKRHAGAGAKDAAFAASAPRPVKNVAEGKRRRTIRIRRKK
jgi:hypothetical protein